LLIHGKLRWCFDVVLKLIDEVSGSRTNNADSGRQASIAVANENASIVWAFLAPDEHAEPPPEKIP
jgi:hypothetical protein